MAIKLDFVLCQHYNSDAKIISAEAENLRFDLFFADILFQIDDVSFDIIGDWIPILDFAAALVYSVDILSSGSQHVELNFVEYEGVIQLQFNDTGQVNISASYNASNANISIESLKTAAQEFAKDVLRRLISQYPALKETKSLRNWYPAKIASI